VHPGSRIAAPRLVFLNARDSSVIKKQGPSAPGQTLQKYRHLLGRHFILSAVCGVLSRAFARSTRQNEASAELERAAVRFELTREPLDLGKRHGAAVIELALAIRKCEVRAFVRTRLAGEEKTALASEAIE
jgi:hypothetical protein